MESEKTEIVTKCATLYPVEEGEKPAYSAD